MSSIASSSSASSSSSSALVVVLGLSLVSTRCSCAATIDPIPLPFAFSCERGRCRGIFFGIVGCVLCRLLSSFHAVSGVGGRPPTVVTANIGSSSTLQHSGASRVNRRHACLDAPEEEEERVVVGPPTPLYDDGTPDDDFFDSPSIG